MALGGFSMKSNVEIAKELGYMKFSPQTLIDLRHIHKYPNNKVVVICTGAQGEKNASLMRIANGEHNDIRLIPGDTVVFSSSVIPGNERSVQHLTDKLYRDGAEVINYKMLDIHAGGHAKQGSRRARITGIIVLVHNHQERGRLAPGPDGPPARHAGRARGVRGRGQIRLA